MAGIRGTGLTAWCKSLLRDERGQDLVEYALLSALIGLAAAGSFQLLLIGVNAAYTAFLSNVNALWEPGAPIGS